MNNKTSLRVLELHYGNLAYIKTEGPGLNMCDMAVAMRKKIKKEKEDNPIFKIYSDFIAQTSGKINFDDDEVEWKAFRAKELKKLELAKPSKPPQESIFNKICDWFHSKESDNDFDYVPLLSDEI